MIFLGETTYKVYAKPKLDQLKQRKRAAIIYHNFTISKPMSSLTVQVLTAYQTL